MQRLTYVTIRDRIISFKRVPAKDLLPNPRNWRTHPDAQADARKGILDEIGFADAVLARETPSGLQLIERHLRAEVAPDAEIPVLILDFNQEEADKLLAVFDPLSAMVEANAEKLAELIDDLETDSEALEAVLGQLATDTGITPPDFQPVS